MQLTPHSLVAAAAAAAAATQQYTHPAHTIAADSAPFDVSSCPYINSAPSLPPSHLAYLGKRYNYSWKKNDVYPVLVFHPGCLTTSNSVFKIWSEKNKACKGGALLILWYGQDLSGAFGVVPFKSAEKNLKPYKPPEVKGGKAQNWDSAARDDGRKREHRGEEVSFKYRFRLWLGRDGGGLGEFREFPLQ